MRRPLGMALLLVTWLLVLLTGLLAGFAVLAQAGHLHGRAALDRGTAMYAAEAGLALAAQRMAAADPQQRWVPDGRPYELQFGEARLELRIHDETGKLDLNATDAVTLARLFVALDVDEPRALRLAGAIVDWRDHDDLLSPHGAEAREYAAAGLPYGPANQPFASVAELQRVLGVDPAVYRDAAPHLTVFTGRPADPAFAQAPVRRALGLDPDAAVPAGAVASVDAGDLALAAAGSGTYAVSSHARLANGAAMEVQATLRIGVPGLSGMPYALLARREGAY